MPERYMLMSLLPEVVASDERPESLFWADLPGELRKKGRLEGLLAFMLTFGKNSLYSLLSVVAFVTQVSHLQHSSSEEVMPKVIGSDSQAVSREVPSVRRLIFVNLFVLVSFSVAALSFTGSRVGAGESSSAIRSGAVSAPADAPSGQAASNLQGKPDDDAVHPAQIDSPFTQRKELFAGDALTNDEFGYSVSISGDTAVVGAGFDYQNGAMGKAYIFGRNLGGANNWGQVKKLTAGDAAAGDRFGGSVSISGDTVVVGAVGKNAAYIFGRNLGGAGNWGQVKKLTAADAATGDAFGDSVSINGDSVVIGADSKSNFTGAAYIFGRNLGGADNWGQVKKLTAGDAADGDQLGMSVSISGDTAVVGANRKNSNTGAVYIFGRNQGGADNWGQAQELTAGDAATNDNFGYSVSISGDTVIVGAMGKNIQTGAAYIFDSTQPLISFSAANYNVNESDGFVHVVVNRTGDIGVAVNVDYATADTGASPNCGALNTGLASSRCDFATMLGTLRFAVNETQKTLDIPINRDSYAEGPEMFTVNLSNLTGGAALVMPSSATVTISDSASPAPNAIDDTTTFVRQHYRDFLNREADAAGLAFWKNDIDKCNDPAQRQPGQTLAQCVEVQRILTSAAFFLSIEFQSSGRLVHDFYVAALDRPATNNMPALNEFERDTQAVQTGVVVGQGNWEQTLNNNRIAFMNDFVMRAEFVGFYPTTDTPTQYVDKLYTHARVTPGSAQERTDAIAEFGGASTAADPGARGRALLRITQNTAFRQRETNRCFVYMEYIGYLRRNPNDPPDGNFAGYDFWLNKLNQFNGDFLKAEMVKAFITSAEYRQRFGP